jgi:alkaline phosphatase D
MSLDGKERTSMQQANACRPTTLLPLTIILFLLSMLPSTARSQYPRLMQGPMVGAVSDRDARIWMRLTGEHSVTVEYGVDPELTDFETCEPIVARKANDYVVVALLQNLAPATQYFYRIKVNGNPDKYLETYPPFRLRTTPPAGAGENFRVAFGSCPRFQDDRVQPIWPVVTGLDPDLFFWIGDNIYGDTLDPDILREEYRRQRDVFGLQPVLHNLSHLAIWDDHDYGMNNHDRTNPIKRESLEVFKQYWANPAYGLPDVPGVFFKQTYGAVDFFFIDDRYYRDPNDAPDTPDKTLLGAEQMSWLESELEASRAVFKVIVSGSGWSVAKGMGGDSWAGFVNERNRLFDFIRDKQVCGVVLLSGDTHVGEINVIPWSDNGGYDLYDLVSSPLAQPAPDSWLDRRPEQRIRPVYFQGSNVGVIDFVMEESPRLVFRLFDIRGRSVWEPFELHASELVNGVQSWPEKVDDDELDRQNAYDAGRGYYEIVPPKSVPRIAPRVVTEPVVHDTDDPAIWVHPTDRRQSLIVGTDKDEDGSLYAFGLDGKIVKRVSGLKRPNNVDVEYGLVLGGVSTDIAVVTERYANKIRVFSLPELEPVDGGGIEVFIGQEQPLPEGVEQEQRAPMGIALYKRPSDGTVFVVVGRKTGPLQGYLWQYRIEDDGTGTVKGTKVREFGTWSGHGEIEAIAVDDALGYVYYSDEGAGIRKYLVDPDAEGAGKELALFGTDGFNQDREGISIYTLNDGTGYILVSDQQDNSFHVFPRDGAAQNPHEHPLLRKIYVSTSDSDGSEVTNADLGEAFPRGLFVAMSDDGTFHYYAWPDLAKPDLVVAPNGGRF